MWHLNDRNSENCAINVQSGQSTAIAVLVTISIKPLVKHQTPEPQEALWHVGLEVTKTIKTTKTVILLINCKMCHFDQNVSKHQQGSQLALCRAEIAHFVSCQVSWELLNETFQKVSSSGGCLMRLFLNETFQKVSFSSETLCRAEIAHLVSC